MELCCDHCVIVKHYVGALFTLGVVQYVAVNSYICDHSCHEKVIFNMGRISGVGVTHFYASTKFVLAQRKE